MKFPKIVLCVIMMLLFGSASAFAVDDEAVLSHNEHAGMSYATIEMALSDAAEGDTIRLLMDADVKLERYNSANAKYFPNNKADHCTVDLNGHVLTILNDNGTVMDDFCFRSTTFKNGTLKLEGGLQSATAIFWLINHQTLTFDNVKLVATGVSGTYLFGFQEDSNTIQFINGSEIYIDNASMMDFVVIADNNKNNKVIFDHSKATINNVAKFAQNTNITIKNKSNISAKNVERGIDLARADREECVIDDSTVTIDGASKSAVRMLNDVINVKNGGKLSITNSKNGNKGIAEYGEAGGTVNVDAESTYKNDDGIDEHITLNIITKPTVKPIVKPTATPVADTSSLPKTGDTSRLTLWFALLAISCVSGIAVMKKHTRANNQ